jgi:hypothetical protein
MKFRIILKAQSKRVYFPLWRYKKSLANGGLWEEEGLGDGGRGRRKGGGEGKVWVTTPWKNVYILWGWAAEA